MAKEIVVRASSHPVPSVTCRFRHFLSPSRREAIVGAIMISIAALLGALVGSPLESALSFTSRSLYRLGSGNILPS
jgi:hypothetical protein